MNPAASWSSSSHHDFSRVQTHDVEDNQDTYQRIPIGSRILIDIDIQLVSCLLLTIKVLDDTDGGNSHGDRAPRGYSWFKEGMRIILHQISYSGDKDEILPNIFFFWKGDMEELESPIL